MRSNVRKHLVSALLLCTVLLLPDAATAALTGSLSFRDRVGVVTPTESIEVWLTLSLDASSDPLITDADRHIVSGVDLSEFGTVDDSYLNTAFLCSGTFTSFCTSGPPYKFTFNVGPDSLVFPRNFDMQPGQSRDFLFGTFAPSNGAVAPGTYRFYTATLHAGAEGLDQAGAPLERTIDLFSTCGNGDDSCAFERTVVAQQVVPEPASVMFVLPAIVAGVVLRKRVRPSAR